MGKIVPAWGKLTKFIAIKCLITDSGNGTKRQTLKGLLSSSSSQAPLHSSTPDFPAPAPVDDVELQKSRMVVPTVRTQHFASPSFSYLSSGPAGAAASFRRHPTAEAWGSP